MQQIESGLADYFPCSFADRSHFGEIVAAVMNLGSLYTRNLNDPRKFDETAELVKGCRKIAERSGVVRFGNFVPCSREI